MQGSILGRYRLADKLGEGGMGSVWRAEDTLLHRVVALKLLPEAIAADEEARKRFLREARVASALEHPGIATVFDAGEIDGRAYIAMQLVDGETVRDRLARGPIPVAEAVGIAANVARALAHAHARGVLHRDVTSRNVMLARDGRIIVVDFGLGVAAGSTRITCEGAALGTAAYVAPEIVRGEVATPASDIYGIGAVLYEMLTGEPPFRGANAGAVLYAAVHEPAAPPSRHRAEIPAWLDAIVLRALSKEPGQRYAGAANLAADLQAEDDGATTIDLGVARARRRRTWRLRVDRRVLLAVAGIGLAALAGFLGLRVLQGPPPAVAVLPFVDSSDEAPETTVLADLVAENLVTKLTGVGSLRLVPWVTSQRFSDAERAVAEIARDLHAERVVTGTFHQDDAGKLRITLAVVDGKSGFQRWARTFESARSEILQVQTEMVTAVARELTPGLSRAQESALGVPASTSAEAYEYYIRGAEALQSVDDAALLLARALFEKAVDIDPRLAEAYVGIGATHTAASYRILGERSPSTDLDLALSSFRQALDIRPEMTRARRGLIHVYLQQGRDEECLRIGREIAELGLEDVENLLARAEAYHSGALWEKAEALYLRVLELDPENANALAFLTITYSIAGRYRDAVRTGEDFVRRFGDDADVPWFLANAYYCADRDIEMAKSCFTRAGLEVPPLYLELAGQPERAREILQAGRSRMETLVAKYPGDVVLRSSLAETLGELGDLEGARREAAFVRAAGEVDPSRLATLGYAMALGGDLDAAITLWREAIGAGTCYHVLYVCLEVHGIEKLRDAPGYAMLLREHEAERARRAAIY